VWLPIRYRDFYDVPHLVLVEHGGALYLLDGQFDEELDDYPDEYGVYRLPDDLRPALDTMSWVDLAHHGERVGSVPLAAVQFDPTKRAAIDSAIFDGISR
jgi:hypothetical protein